MTEISEARWAELRDGRWSRSDAREVMDAWSASGDSARGFASRHGLNPQRLYWWRQRLTEVLDSPLRDPVTALVPVKVVDASETTGAMVLLHLSSGVVLEVPPSVSPEWVAALVRSLRED